MQFSHVVMIRPALKSDKTSPAICAASIPTIGRHAKIQLMKKPSALANWTPEQIALGKRWVETWKLAAVDLERIRRKEIRELDTYKTISLLCGSADYTKPPYAPKPWSGLIEQQRWFKKAAGRE
jgi:hypothetical protein